MLIALIVDLLQFTGRVVILGVICWFSIRVLQSYIDPEEKTHWLLFALLIVDILLHWVIRISYDMVNFVIFGTGPSDYAPTPLPPPRPAAPPPRENKANTPPRRTLNIPGKIPPPGSGDNRSNSGTGQHGFRRSPSCSDSYHDENSPRGRSYLTPPPHEASMRYGCTEDEIYNSHIRSSESSRNFPLNFGSNVSYSLHPIPSPNNYSSYLSPNLANVSINSNIDHRSSVTGQSYEGSPHTYGHRAESVNGYRNQRYGPEGTTANGTPCYRPLDPRATNRHQYAPRTSCRQLY